MSKAKKKTAATTKNAAPHDPLGLERLLHDECALALIGQFVDRLERRLTPMAEEVRLTKERTVYAVANRSVELDDVEGVHVMLRKLIDNATPEDLMTILVAVTGSIPGKALDDLVAAAMAQADVLATHPDNQPQQGAA